MLYSCLTAAPPVHAGAALPDVPPVVVPLLAKAMATAVTDRYATCGEFAADLHKLCGGTILAV